MVLIDAMNPASADIGELRNMGPTSAQWLRDSGICTQSQLRMLGPVVAFQIVRERSPKASLNLLWAMAAGLDGLDWRELTVEQKHLLTEELRQLTQASDD